VLTVLASPVCPLQEEVLRQPLLARITAFIRMQYRVRELVGPMPPANPSPQRLRAAAGAGPP